MLNFSLKAECLDFMDGWPTSVAAMSAVLKPTGNLGSLVVDDPDSALDALLDNLIE